MRTEELGYSGSKNGNITGGQDAGLQERGKQDSQQENIQQLSLP